jgi:CRISPR-associated protein Csm3
MSSDIKLCGRVFIHATVQALTGLHIGGSSAGMEIGGLDNSIIRDPLTSRPYIPGSSLRGKMRSQLEKTLGLRQNNSVGQVKIHTCKTSTEYNQNGGCPVCHVFGVPGEVEATGPTLLIVRDALLSDQSAVLLQKAHTDFAFSELKTEVAIDRVTSQASPRTIERVPAGAEFGPVEMVFSIYSDADADRLKYVIDGLQLIEDDYLGGYGSRGSGKVAFKNLQLSARRSDQYTLLAKYSDGRSFDTVQSLAGEYAAFQAWIRQTVL